MKNDDREIFEFCNHTIWSTKFSTKFSNFATTTNRRNDAREKKKIVLRTCLTNRFDKWIIDMIND